MSMTNARLAIPLSLLGCVFALPAAADATFFSTGDPDGKIATATRPDGGTASTFEIESADDFVLTHSTSITSATFTGLIPVGATATHVVVEIYRVFPKDSNTARTPNVPTRTNSPSDVAFDSRDSATSGDLTFSPTGISPFSVSNSVQPGGIHPKPGQTTGGDGPVTGEDRVTFDVTLTKPFALPADHYFFVPQVQLDSGDFLWLSALRPIDATGTPFPPGFTDLQSWTRDAMLDPDWLRVGQDIVGGDPFPTFNAAFSLTGAVVPEPSTWAMMLLGFAGLGFAGWRRAKRVSSARA
jgi:hypothetical protein